MLVLLSVPLRNLIFHGCTKVVSLKNRAITGVFRGLCNCATFPPLFSYARGGIFSKRKSFSSRVKFYVGGELHNGASCAVTRKSAPLQDSLCTTFALPDFESCTPTGEDHRSPLVLHHLAAAASKRSERPRHRCASFLCTLCRW